LSSSHPDPRFGIVDLPQPDDLDAQFVYNFFTPNERTNDSGNAAIQGKSVSNAHQSFEFQNEPSVLDARIPRYIVLSWKRGESTDYNPVEGMGSLTNMKDVTIQREVEITTNRYMSVGISDPDGPDRIAAKLKALSDLEQIPFEASDQAKKLADLIGQGIEKSTLQPLISPKLSDLVVNFKTNKEIKDRYDLSRSFSLHSQISYSSAATIFGGDDDISPLSSTGIRSAVKQIAAQKDQKSTDVLTVGDVELKFAPFNVTKDSNVLGLKTIQHIGYEIDRSQYDAAGNKHRYRSYTGIPIDSENFIDSEIVYGTKYCYEVRNIYLVIANVQDQSSTPVQTKRISFLVSSRPTASKTVVTKEITAPEPPDGVLYRFNYEKGKGLLITWQLPSGKSRDVKYFQIFKRASIKSEFFCIGMLDFDDSEIKVMKPEFVRADLVKRVGRYLEDGTFKVSRAQTHFEDTDFDRDHEPAIYAVCAVDAHGLTSGYSAQTEVSFDRTHNEIKLKLVSRSGAPKQYPNFFVDPDMDDNISVDSFSQDAIFDSGRSVAKFYFTPDMITARDNDGNENRIVVTEHPSPAIQRNYKIQIINLDLQKSTTAEIVVNDKS
tara:strand:- start:789 stop:2600 length:1812 start_codon:yes stop_codon:yes gene_type:complete